MAVKYNLCWVFLVFVTFHLSFAQVPTSIQLGSGFTAGSNTTWSSPSGYFAFGFYPLPTGLYLVGIWFDKIQQKTLVWSANRNDPAETGSDIRLTFGGQLVLTYRNGSILNIHTGAPAALGLMRNDGNFVLRDSTPRNIWQSFDSPTDTILPGQIVVEGTKLFSNAKRNLDYSRGNFMLEMQNDGKLVLSAYHFADPGYWLSDLTSQNNVSLVFNLATAFMYLVNGTNDIIHELTTNLSVRVEDYYHRAAIDDFGNFQQYMHHRSNGSSWIRVWRAITDPCIVNSVCGVYGFCTTPDNETVTCNCLQGYIPLDPTNPSKGCRPEIVLNYCADPSTRNFTVEVIDDADFAVRSFADLARVEKVDVEECKKAVMDDCYTMAASLENSTCIKTRMPLLNARKSASTKGIKALIKVPMKISNSGSSEFPKKKSRTRDHLKAGLLASGVLALFFFAMAIYYHPAARKVLRRKWSPSATAIGINFRQFTYQELHKATNGFTKILGHGSSGKVYSGILSLKDIEIEIAVKKLEKVTEKGQQEFITELKIIGRTHHKNLVRLLGFCIEDDHWILVYELMKNGSLSEFLFKEGERPSWSHRSELPLGIARGLLYLHEGCETQIIHCDIKPQNVLLDVNYTAKIADFGLSKLLNKDQTRTNTRARGTTGYMAPEWLRNAPITSKVDIYSFGVMLLEIICARRHIELNRVEEESEEDDLLLSSWVISCLKSRKLEMVVRHDPEVLSDFKRFERMAMIGLWCIHPDAFLRPSMKKVTQWLEGTEEVEIPPLVHHQ